MLAYDYPLLGLFWSMFMFFIWIAWLFLIFRIFADIFRSDDIGGWAKAAWSIFVIVVPLLGAVVYVIARGKDMNQRDLETAQASEAAFRDYVRETASGGTSTAEEISKLAALRDAGTLTDEEFQAQKAKLLV